MEASNQSETWKRGWTEYLAHRGLLLGSVELALGLQAAIFLCPQVSLDIDSHMCACGDTRLV